MKAIVCVDKDFGIGKNNSLPWPKNKADLKFFREITWGKSILMGRKTFEGLGVMFLENRDIWVLTKLNCQSVWGTELNTWPSYGRYTDGAKLPNDIIICGGREVYDQFLPICDELFLTHLDKSYDCDTYFPYSQVGIDRLFPKKTLIREIEGGKIFSYTK